MPTDLTRHRNTLADELRGVAEEAAAAMAADDFDPNAGEYTALRENRERIESQLRDVDAILSARELAEPLRPRTPSGEQMSDFGRVLREYDGRGNSERFEVPYLSLRELQTGDEYFTPTPSRITVAQLPLITPTLDSLRQVAVGSNAYDFVVPTPVPLASTVAEGAQKPTRTWDASKVVGTLETDAHIVDVTRQTLEDDTTAERTLRAWLSDGVRKQQDAKAAAVIAAAAGTLTATGATLLAAIRAGKAELSALGVNATAVHVNPDDAASIDLEAMASGHTGPQGVPVVFGMSVVENPAITVGAPLVGAMRDAVYFVYRNNIQTYITDSGMTQETTPRDRFSHNLFGILAEGRSRTHIVQPQLLVKCTVSAARASSAKA